MIKTAVVILNWNGRHHMEAFLASVVRFSIRPDCQVYVADNHSEDDSIEWIEKHFPQVKILSFPQNFGFAQGYNMALEAIEADYCLLLNSDVEVTEGWLEPLENLMEMDETIAAVVPKIRSYHQPDFFEYAGAAGGYIDRFGFPFCRGRVFDHMEQDLGQYDDRRDIFWATGAAMLVRTDLFQLAGGLDPDFFAHMEEIDLCWRLKNMGYRIVYEPASLVYHVGGGTLPMNHPKKLFLNFRNNLFLLFKNLSTEDLFFILTARLFLDGIAALKFLAGMQPRYFFAIWKAHFAFFLSVPLLLKKRKKLIKKFVGYHHPEIFPGSIVFQYFIKRKTEFRQLEAWPKKNRRIEPKPDENPLC